MAAEISSMPVNGNYAQQHQPYTGMEHQQNYHAYAANATTQQSAQQPTPAAATQQAEIPKDEVGWYFVEQYYTTLSRSPDKLFLFYNKRSQFVSGQETDKVAVCVGQRAINDRIKELDFQECKVRVTNVDSQASDSNIVIQVIGEISNRSQPHKKFTQTFVLAAQTNGYFVLNDIFRYLIEEEDEGAELPAAGDAQETVATPEPSVRNAAPVPESAPKTLTSSDEPAAVASAAEQVAKIIEEKVASESLETKAASEPKVNGVAAAASPEEALPGNENKEAAAPSTVDAAALQPEKPKAPEPTPVASPAKPAAPQPAAVPKPAVPKTWASLAASANKGIAPAATASSAAPAATSAAGAPAKSASQPAKAATPASAASSAAPAQVAESEASPAPANEQDEWTAVGSAHNRQQSRQVPVPQQESPTNRGYIKNVHDGIDGAALRAEIEKHAEVTYFDIAPQKNCAFVDFKTADGYNAALKANPYAISGEELYVEERRIRPGSTPYVPRGQYQGRGRGGNNTGAPRGNFQGGRGGFAPRGRGAMSLPRGRGGAPAA